MALTDEEEAALNRRLTDLEALVGAVRALVDQVAGLVTDLEARQRV